MNIFDINGVERGYARGILEKNFLRCEALHCKPCNHVKRSIKITQLSELSLISALIHLSDGFGINKIHWQKVGAAHKYELLTKKRQNGKIIKFTKVFDIYGRQGA